MTVYGRHVSTHAEAGCVGCEWEHGSKSDSACRVAARRHAEETDHVTFTRTMKTRLFKRQPAGVREVELAERGTV